MNPDLNASPLRPPLSNENQAFLERFKSFWAAPTAERVGEVISPNARVHFAGAGWVSGTEYVGLMGQALEGTQDIKVDVVDYADSGDLLFIFWNASASIQGQRREWHGVDRFRLKDGMAIEEYVIFDPQVLQG